MRRLHECCTVRPDEKTTERGALDYSIAKSAPQDATTRPSRPTNGRAGSPACSHERSSHATPTPHTPGVTPLCVLRSPHAAWPCPHHGAATDTWSPTHLHEPHLSTRLTQPYSFSDSSLFISLTFGTKQPAETKKLIGTAQYTDPCHSYDIVMPPLALIVIVMPLWALIPLRCLSTPLTRNPLALQSPK